MINLKVFENLNIVKFLRNVIRQVNNKTEVAFHNLTGFVIELPKVFRVKEVIIVCFI